MKNKLFSCNTLSVPSSHATRRKRECWLPKSRQGKTRGIAVAPFRCLVAMPPEGCTRVGKLPGCPSLDRGSREAEVGFEPRIFLSSVNLRPNHLGHLAQVDTSSRISEVVRNCHHQVFSLRGFLQNNGRIFQTVVELPIITFETVVLVQCNSIQSPKPNDPYLPWGFPEEFDLCDAVRVTDLKKITQCIGDGAQIDFLDGFGRTPLHYACQHGSYEATKMLLGNKAKVNIMDANRTTPLHLAAGGNHSAITKLLLLNGADIKVECLSGCRAVDFAPYGSETWQVLVDAETGKLPDVDDLTKTKLIPLVPKFAIQREIERQRALEEAKQQKKGKNKQVFISSGSDMHDGQTSCILRDRLLTPRCGCLARWLEWLEREFTDRKVRGSNPTSASRLLSRLR
ncbi:hypothetical protein CSKR_110670 [Clonorchis sinensis]|uniref:Uncharacterized protein n=1 Tax=Clonorchis sinensis TaxID=79923 RepID=A0A3R7EWK9_CLOSI|nr:hypothetical protein CSKR_110670 [Clonorchis sinensis]